MSNILTIDCGTTSTRAIVFNKHQHPSNTSQQPLSLKHPNDGWVEQDPNEIWSKTQQCLIKSISEVGSKNISAIGITNQRESTIIWNKKTGAAIGPAISWQCRRTTSRCNDLSHYSDQFREKTGLPLDPYFSATKFEWLINEYPETKSLLEKNSLCFGTVDTWLLWNLTKGESYATDVTNASRTLLYNIHTLSYDEDLCDVFNIPLNALPDVHHSAHNFGNYVHTDGISIPIHSIIGDQQAALFAQCGRNQDMIKNTYGTGLFLMANTGQTINQSPSLISTIAIGINDSVDYAVEGSIFTGGSLMHWLTEIGILDTPSESESLAKSVENNGGISIIPALSGLGAPYWQPDATGIIMGLTRATSKGHICRAALESIVYQTQDVIESLYDSFANLELTTMKVDGGATNNDWLMQFQANISNLTIERPSSIEATALGAAICAASVLDLWPKINTPSSIKFSPTLSNDLRDEYISSWKKALAKYF